MSDTTRAPAPRPCESCPYRQDCPSGLWVPDEYLKLLEYDKPMELQPQASFACHQQDGRLCAGWVACHGTDTLAIRLLGFKLSPEVQEAVANYETDVPVFATGREACIHGLRDVQDPGPEADRLIEKLERQRDRRAAQ